LHVPGRSYSFIPFLRAPLRCSSAANLRLPLRCSTIDLWPLLAGINLYWGNFFGHGNRLAAASYVGRGEGGDELFMLLFDTVKRSGSNRRGLLTNLIYVCGHVPEMNSTVNQCDCRT
jgi:hypothetical protein